MVKYAALANTFKAETIDDAVQQIVDMEIVVRPII